MEGRFFLITGCSAGGKSTLLSALAAQGFSVVEEPGRRIVRAAMAREGDRTDAEDGVREESVLPWVDPAAFARRALAVARTDLEAAAALPPPVFFDRGLIDAAVGLQHYAGIPIRETLGRQRPYDDPVFLAPPWEDLFSADEERRHSFHDAADEYERISKALDALEHRTVLLPKAPVEARVAFVKSTLAVH